MVQQRLGGAVREQREVAPGQVGRVDHFLQRDRRQVRHALAAELDGRRQPRPAAVDELRIRLRSEEHTSELQSLMRISYAVFCLKKKNQPKSNTTPTKIHT